MNCTHHHSCVLKVPIFQGLDSNITDHIEEIVHQHRYNKDEHLFYQGDPSNALYIIHKGLVKIYKLSDDGKEQTIRILFPGDFFGQSSLVAKKLHYVSAQVLEPVEVCVIDQAYFQKMMNNHPEIALNMFTALNERLHEADEWMSTISLHEAERRLAKLLLMFDQKLNVNDEYFTLPLAKKELAPLIGSTRETVSRKLTKFAQSGIIEMRGQRSMRIKDISKLTEIAGED